MNFQEIVKANEAIRKEMDRPVNHNVPDQIVEKLNKLSNILGLSSQCIADSEVLYSKKIEELIQDRQYSKMTATDKKLLFNSLASEEMKVMNYSAQLNKDLHYCVESCRSMLSYLKSEMQASIAG